MKKSILFIALAAAIVIGCTTEVLDTSYESVLKEAVTKGDHPMVLNAYVGNGMMQTRTTLTGSVNDYTTLIPSGTSRIDGTVVSDHNNLIRRSAGVFAYYSGTNTVDFVQSSANFYSGSQGSYTTENGLIYGYYYDSSHVISKYLNNAQLYYESSWKTKLVQGSNTWLDSQVYWPTLTTANSSSEYMTFFAYYPHVDTYSNDYGKKSNNFRVETAGEYGFPMLDYTVATAVDGLPSLDLMVAKPVVNQKIQDYNTVNFEFKHLLAAVSVNLQYKDDNYSSSTSPKIFFTRASMQGVDQNDKVCDEAKFRKRGVFSMATGQWIYRNNFEHLDLLGYTWLTQASIFDLDDDKYYPLYEKFKPSGNTSLSVTSDFSNPGNDKFMLIIPNDKQKKLKVDLSYTIINGGFSENVDLSKLIDLQIKPGYIYQINLVIEKKKLNFNVTVNNWTYDSTTNI